MTTPIESGGAAPLDRSSYPRGSAQDVEALLNKCRGRVESLYVFLDEGFLASADPLLYLVGAYDALEGVQVVLSEGAVGFPLESSSSKSFDVAERMLITQRETLRVVRATRKKRNTNG